MGDVTPAEETELRAARSQLFESSMRNEARRLRTFWRWPGTSPVSARDLVKAGFFFVGPRDEVQCFCCGGVLKDWAPGDCPVVEHLKFFPSCKFICGEDVGNQEMLPLQEIFDTVDGQFLSLLQGIDSEETALPNAPEYPEMVTEEMRLATFQNWPQYTDMHPEQLARAGFFYTGRCLGKCFQLSFKLTFEGCHVLNRCFPSKRSVCFEIHGRWYIVMCSSVLSGSLCSVLHPSLGPHPELVECLRCQIISYCLFSGQGDVVRCFYCDGGVRNWSFGDDPWREHAKWYPGNWELQAPPSLDQFTVVQNVLQMGFDPTWVANLVENKYLLTGTFYLSESELISDLLQPDWEESSNESRMSTEEQLRRLQEERMCKVCMDRDVSVVFVPCGHLVACGECALNLRLCPICRAVIQGNVRTFMS
uniref:RING-type E3 ubiquitin transferase n=1 Tax=Strix occidentalis caurina TaxID=311401 RepID=A0A8D0FSD3_STROC